MLSSGYSVQHSTGNDTIFGLTINKDNSLAVTGGSLTVTSTTNQAGSLTLSSGGYFATGNLINTGTINGRKPSFQLFKTSCFFDKILDK